MLPCILFVTVHVYIYIYIYIYIYMIVKKYTVVKKGRKKHTKSVNVDAIREYYKMVHELYISIY